MSASLAVGVDADRLVAQHWPAPGDALGEVVLLHGGGQTRHAWRGTAQALSANGWTCTAYDARGHGESAWNPDGDYSQDGLLSDLFRIIAECASPPVLVGASMGGITSIIACGEHPDTFRGLVAVDVALQVDTVESERVSNFMLANAEGFPDLESAARAVQAYNPARAQPPSPDGLRRNLVQRQDGRWYWRWDRRLLDQRSAMPELTARLRAAAKQIAAPTLLIRGEQSEMVSDALLEEFLQHVPHADVADIAGASHMVAGDDNDSFTAAVVSFLDRQILGGPG